jgi:hypothetical protein
LYTLVIFLSFGGFAQNKQLSSKAEISVITCDPGTELYASFGHSAFRVLDRTGGIDQVYNYGTFNFNTPNFYLKFAQGKLLYDLSTYPFYYFLRSYVEENRTVKEQVLDLDQNSKQRFYDFLENNAKPENKSYLYDFFFDNCATKLPEVTGQVLDGKLRFKTNFADTEQATFRELIHRYLDKKPWGKFGIDLALGSVIDRKASSKEYQFLPDYIYKSYEKAFIKKDSIDTPLVARTNILFQSTPSKESGSNLLTPLFVFSLIALLLIWITITDIKNKKRTRWVDFVLFLTTGLVGLIVLLLWFATDHTATAKNFNILWAFMPNTVVAFYMLNNKLKVWLKSYQLLLIVLMLVTVGLWLFKIQVFSAALIPVFILLLLRYSYLYLSKSIYK